MPALYNISPDSGSLTGGYTIMLQGIGLTGLTAVYFGSVKAAGLNVISDKKAICVVPASPLSNDNQAALTLHYGAAVQIFPSKFMYYNMINQVGYQAFLDGLDVSQYVTSWGTLEQIRQLLLASPQMFTSEVTIELYNYQNFLSPGKSTMQGFNWFNLELEIRVYGVTVFIGLIIDVPVVIDTSLAQIKARSIFNKLATTSFNETGRSVNPGELISKIVNSVIPKLPYIGNSNDFSPYVNYRSLDTCGSEARVNGATINYQFDANTTCLDAIQKISDLCSIDFYIYGFVITAKAFNPLTSQINVKAEILDDFVKEWQTLESSYLTFYNLVNMYYPTGKAVTLNDTISQRQNNTVQDITFVDTDPVCCADYNSALYFGSLYLKRNAKRRTKITVLGKADFYQFVLGDRVWVTQSMYGYNKKPFEIIEVHRDLDNKGCQLALAEL